MLNDRDAWTTGVFASDWVAKVLTLPGIAAKHWQVLRSTADSIITNARTGDGHFGGSWAGPAEGPGSIWWVAGSRPGQIMTSATSASMVIAAALLETQNLSPHQPSLAMSRSDEAEKVILRIQGTPQWTYATESSTNLDTWIRSGVYLLNGPARDITITNPAASPRAFYRAYIYFDP